MNPLAVTMVTGGVLGLMFAVLSARVTVARARSGISLGDHGTSAILAGQESSAPKLMLAQRAHLNFAEWVPLSLILLALTELMGAPRWLMLILALMLLVGRALHPFGIGRRAPNPLRGGGFLLNLGMLVVCSLYVLIAAL